ncbi:hypothetical protein IDJ77_25520 [Mucilaginibacter sp. ZT4R22]|uniref:Asl1-like glycosyl hydrolase catalytic domain-containing protein n=1 Tax=Mucilaginibacter pankratovii TaxID=2772110 RepID=A0ABR7WY31_9SPHI|nr:glycosyl hydrolase [Mucilaginibacter pankratovii]MBD1367197.1 hypothetical protein [Mucilaginibacter pankratovii]
MAVEPSVPKLSLSSSALLMSAKGAPTETNGMMLGINGHPFGDAPYLAVTAANQINLIKGMGMSWYRINVRTTSDGTISASSSHLFNKLQKSAEKGNIGILPMLYTRTLDLTDSEDVAYKKGRTLGANFALKYGQYFTYYDLGNDLELKLLLPNKTGRSQDHYDRQKFNTTAAYLKGMDEGIKANDADAKTMIDAGWLHYAFLRMCDWYGIKFDVVAYHWYSDMEGVAANGRNNVPDITLKLSELFPDKPIWFTEFNYRYKAGKESNEEDQHTFVSKFIAKCRNNPQVKVAIIYQLFDEPYKSFQESNYGIVKWQNDDNGSYLKWTKKLLGNVLSY